MKEIIVSAHGGRWSDQAEDLHIPQNSEVVYYVADGGILSNNDGYTILDSLKQGKEPGVDVSQRVSESFTYDYSCWYAPEFAADCGIFEVGTGNLLKDLSTYDESNPLLLSELLDSYPNTKIYWVCCREITVRSTTPSLRNSAGAYPIHRS